MATRLLLLAALAAGCGREPDDDPFRDAKGVLTLQHFVAAGHRRALAAAEQDPDFKGLYAAVKDAVVRVQVQYPSKTAGYTDTDHGSGALVGGGRYVATAGHVVDAIGREGARARVILTDGRVVPAHVVRWRDELVSGVRSDWALLELVDPPDGLPSLEIGEADAGVRALLLGYPSRIGIAPDGRARIDDVAEPRALAPVASIVRVEDVVWHDVKPIAGAIAIEGISGAPLVDAGRRVVGIQHRLTTHNNADDSWTTYQCDDAEDLQQLLHELER